MTCNSIELREDGEGGRVLFSPVISGSDENDEFYKWTPGGELVLDIVRLELCEKFNVGEEYYVDVTPCTEAE